MNRRAAHRSLMTLVFLLAAACVPEDGVDPDEEEEGPDATGKWSGGVTGVTFELVLLELERGEVSGTGTLRGANGTAFVDVQKGTHDHPDIDLTLGASGVDSVTLSGTFKTDDEIRGKANGSGFSAAPFALVRQ